NPGDALRGGHRHRLSAGGGGPGRRRAKWRARFGRRGSAAPAPRRRGRGSAARGARGAAGVLGPRATPPRPPLPPPPPPPPAHPWRRTPKGKAAAPHRGMGRVGKIMAAPGGRASGDPSLIGPAKAEPAGRTKDHPYECPIPADVGPPLDMAAD